MPKKKKRPALGGKFGWNKTITLSFIAKRRDDRVIAIIVTQNNNGWSAVAVESNSSNKSLNAIFDDHAHAVIAEEVSSLRAVKRAAENYVATWKRAKLVPPPCDCEPIIAPAG